MKKILAAVLLTPVVSMALPIKPGEQFKVQIPGEYIIKTAGEKINQPIKRKLGKNLFLVKAKSINTLSMYKKVFPNFAYYGDFKESMSTPRENTPNDVHFDLQFHHKMIQTTQAWKTTKGDPSLVIAVTDNEFQLDHKDLVSAWWKNPGEIAGNKVDDDNNGYVDDVYGWDFMGVDNDVDSTEEPTHGTHVSGIIAATANNKIGVAGIAPNVKIMPLKWYGPEGTWNSAMISETYHYAVDNGAKIISTSYGIDHLVDDEAYLEALKYIKDNNVILFNSAGNANEKNPDRQKIEDVILVCSVKSKDDRKVDRKSRFSNYGTGIDICAPGDPIYSTVQRSQGPEGAYAKFEGTSMSTPAVAAVAALIWSAHPNFTDEEVIQRLYDSADNIDSKNRRYKGLLGAGRLNAFKAVK